MRMRISDPLPSHIVVDGLDECDGVKEQGAFLGAISGAIGRHHLPLYFITTSHIIVVKGEA